MNLPESIENIVQLEELLCRPNQALVDMMRRLKGDIMILGVAGKMGVTMAILAVNAIREAGVKKRVIGVARFSNPEERSTLEAAGVELGNVLVAHKYSACQNHGSNNYDCSSVFYDTGSNGGTECICSVVSAQ